MNNRNRRESGIGVIGMIFLIPVLLIVAAVAWYEYCEARKAYWDHRVKEMCAKDGGVKVYERIPLPQRYVDSDGFIRIPPGDKADSNDLFSYSLETKKIKEGDLAVYRYHITVIRRTDSTLLGESVIYGRSGGDFPTFAYPSRFVCPENQGESQLINAIFLRNKIQ